MMILTGLQTAQINKMNIWIFFLYPTKNEVLYSEFSYVPILRLQTQLLTYSMYHLGAMGEVHVGN